MIELTASSSRSRIVLFVHAGRVPVGSCRRQRAFVPNSLRNSMRVGLQVTVDLFPARTRG